MSRYGKIESGFWRNQKVRALTERARLLLAYLYSCPHGNAAGCFVLPDGYIAADLVWTTETVSQTLSELFKRGFAERDSGTDLLRVIGWFDHNAIENENVAKRVVKDVNALPKCEARQRLIDELKGLTTVHETVQRTLSKGLPEPSRNQEPNRTQQEPEREPRAREDKKSEIASSPIREPSLAARLGIEILRVYREVLGDSAEIPDTGMADVWLHSGYDPPLIVATIREHLQRKRKFVPLLYFKEIIPEAHQKRNPAPARIETESEKKSRWAAALDRLIAEGRKWPCRVPPEIPNDYAEAYMRQKAQTEAA